MGVMEDAFENKQDLHSLYLQIHHFSDTLVGFTTRLCNTEEQRKQVEGCTKNIIPGTSPQPASSQSVFATAIVAEPPMSPVNRNIFFSPHTTRRISFHGSTIEP